MNGKAFSYVVFCDCFHFHVLFVFKRIISHFACSSSLLFSQTSIFGVLFFWWLSLGLIVTMMVLLLSEPAFSSVTTDLNDIEIESKTFFLLNFARRS